MFDVNFYYPGRLLATRLCDNFSSSDIFLPALLFYLCWKPHFSYFLFRKHQNYSGLSCSPYFSIESEFDMIFSTLSSTSAVACYISIISIAYIAYSCISLTTSLAGMPYMVALCNVFNHHRIRAYLGIIVIVIYKIFAPAKNYILPIVGCLLRLPSEAIVPPSIKNDKLLCHNQLRLSRLSQRPFHGL